MSGPARALLALMLAWSACATPRAPAHRAGPGRPSKVVLPAGPQPIIVQRSVRERVTSSRRELEAIAMRSADREASAEALFALVLLDLDAEEAAWESPDPEVLAASARTRAIGNLRQLIDRVPRATRRDDALYLLGICLANAGNMGGARDAFERLISEHPASRHAPEAWFRLGEIEFDRGNNPGAARAYQAAAGRADSRFATIALYKLGWTRYRARLFAEAADAFARMLASPDRSAEAVALRPEAARLLDAARARDAR